MAYGKLTDGVLTYPYDLAAFRAEHPNVMLDWSDPNALTLFDVFEVIEDERPSLALGQFADLGDPVLIAGVWRRQWTLRSATADELAARQAVLLALVDQGAGQFRRNFITDIPGQDATYKIKGDEAAAFAENPSGTYPYLQADATATGRPIADVAAEIAGIAAQWTAINAKIEAQRVAAKREIEAAAAAGDWTGMELAARVDWPGLLT